MTSQLPVKQETVSPRANSHVNATSERPPPIISGSGVSESHPSCRQPLQIQLYDPHAASNKTRSHHGIRHNVVIDRQGPQFDVRVDEKGVRQGTYITFGKGIRIRRKMTKSERQELSSTRERGACISCHPHKTRCARPKGHFAPCARCRKIFLVDFAAQPCIKISIMGAKMHRSGPTTTITSKALRDWMQHQADLQNENHSMYAQQGIESPWGPLQQLCLHQDLGLELRVLVCKFQPAAGDATSYLWKDANGSKRELTMPPYYIPSLDFMNKPMQDYIIEAMDHYPEALLRKHNPLILTTFRFASHLRKSSTLVTNALRLWTATRLTECTWRVSNTDVLGVQPSNEEGNPWSGYVPVTPIMDTQLDYSAIQALLIPIRQNLLKELDQIMKDNTRDTWFEVYLALFITLDNFEWMFRDIITYTDRHGMTKPAFSRGKSMSEAYVNACKSLLSRYHYSYTHSRPISSLRQEDWTTSAMRTYMAPDQIAYLILAQAEIQEQDRRRSTEPDIRDWTQNSMYKEAGYWSSQLFDPKWLGDKSDPIDGFTEEDFMTS